MDFCFKKTTINNTSVQRKPVSRIMPNYDDEGVRYYYHFQKFIKLMMMARITHENLKNMQRLSLACSSIVTRYLYKIDVDGDDDNGHLVGKSTSATFI